MEQLCIIKNKNCLQILLMTLYLGVDFTSRIVEKLNKLIYLVKGQDSVQLYNVCLPKFASVIYKSITRYFIHDFY